MGFVHLQGGILWHITTSNYSATNFKWGNPKYWLNSHELWWVKRGFFLITWSEARLILPSWWQIQNLKKKRLHLLLILEEFWLRTWLKHTRPHTHTLTAHAYWSSFPFIAVPQRPCSTFFRDTSIGLKLMTSSPGHTITVFFKTTSITSLLLSYPRRLIVKHSIVYLVHKGAQEHGTRGDHMTLCYLLCLSDFPHAAYQWPSWRNRTKDGLNLMISCWGKGNIVFPYFPSCYKSPGHVTRHHVHLTGYLSQSLTRYILSGNYGGVSVCGQGSMRRGADKKEYVIVIAICC